MQLHIISSFHYDYLYLQNSEKYFEITFRILDAALDLLEKEAEWNFTVEQMIPVEEYLRRFPEKLPVMRRFAQEGRLCFAPGMYVMPDMNMIDAESLFLQAKYGKKFLQETFGVDAKCCWIADCWGHHAQLPQILTQSGYEAYFFWRCMRPDFEKMDFRWQGLDGSVINTHWLATGYADLSFPADEKILHSEELSFAQGSAKDILQRLDKTAPFVADENGPKLLCNGGDFRMPQASCIGVLRKLKGNAELPEMQFSTPEKFTAELNIDKLSLTDGEFNGAFKGCYSTNILIKQLLYYGREQLLAKETFAALTNRDDVTENEWKKLLRHFFHDTVCGTICDDAFDSALAELRSFEKTQSEYLFNPILRSRHEIFENADGKHCEVILAPHESCKLNEFAEMPELKNESASGCFKNRFFSCNYDEKGRIISLKTANGCEIADSSSKAWFGLPVMQFDYGDNWLYYEAPLSGGSDAAARTDNRPDPLYRKADDNPLVNRDPVFIRFDEANIRRSERECVITQKCHLQFWRMKVEFALTVSMDDISPLLKYKLDINPDGKYYRLRAAFPTLLQGGEVHHCIPCGIQKRDNCEYPADGFMHLGNEKCGLFLLNRGIPGNNTDENGVMMLSLFRSVAMEYKCPSEKSFNIGVPHTFEYAVLPHDGTMYNDQNAAVIENYLRPLQSAESAAAGILPELPPNVRLLAMRRHPQGIFLRLAEVWGQNAEYAVPQSYVIANGLEEIVSEKTSEILNFRPFEIKNIILKVQ